MNIESKLGSVRYWRYRRNVGFFGMVAILVTTIWLVVAPLENGTVSIVVVTLFVLNLFRAHRGMAHHKQFISHHRNSVWLEAHPLEVTQHFSKAFRMIPEKYLKGVQYEISIADLSPHTHVVKDGQIVVFPLSDLGHEPDEIAAILGHEIAHRLHRDTEHPLLLKIIGGTAWLVVWAGIVGSLVYLLSALLFPLTQEELMLGVRTLAICTVLLLIVPALTDRINSWSKKQAEYAADAFAASLVGTGALAKVFARSLALGEITAEPYPSQLERIQAMINFRT